MVGLSVQAATGNLLLATKLYIPPARARRVDRARLIEGMQAAVRRPLTLICAPAGYGKTTLLSEWIPQNEHCVTWLSLDEGDNDPVRFWRYFIAALQTLNPELGKNAQLLMESSQAPPIETVLSLAINDMAAQDYEFSHVFDDYHLIDNPAIDENMTFLIEHLPPNAHLVITSRSDPALPLARWRARRQLSEIRSRDLRFTGEEAASFFNQAMRLDLSAAEIAALKDRTEGWIAGLQLAALSIKDIEDRSRFITAFAGSHRFIVDYLVEEVLSRQPEAVRQFLLSTSILKRLNGTLCNALTGRNDGQAILEGLEQANLFLVPLDNDRNWYRYHHLFAEVLQGYLQQTHPELPPQLHERAGDWYARQGMTEMAVHHALAIPDFERAAVLIEGVAGNMLRGGSSASIVRWLNAIPEETILAHPRMCMARAWTYFLGAGLNLEAAEEWALLALQAESAKGAPGAELSGEAAALQSMVAVTRGEAALSREFSRQALESLSPDSPWRTAVTFTLGTTYLDSGEIDAAANLLSEALRLSQADGTHYVQLAAASFLGDIEMFRGDLDRARELYQQVLTWSNPELPQKGSAMAHAGMANIHYEQDRLDEALAHIYLGIKQADQAGGVWARFVVDQVLARVQQAQGNWPDALDTLERLQLLGQSAQVSLVVTQATALRARMQLARGDLKAAQAWAANSELSPDDQEISHPGWAVVEYLTLARLLAAQGEVAEALTLLDRLLEAAQVEERKGSVIEILIAQALCYQAQGDRSRALDRLERALILAEPEGYARIFIDEGEPMRALLAEFKASITKRSPVDVSLPPYADRLLSAFTTTEFPLKPDPTNGRAAPNRLAEPLSERELEVLRLIAAGLTNQVIAEQLVIALSTVKSHINSLYGKLGARSRVQAITIARELGVLADDDPVKTSVLIGSE